MRTLDSDIWPKDTWSSSGGSGSNPGPLDLNSWYSLVTVLRCPERDEIKRTCGPQNSMCVKRINKQMVLGDELWAELGWLQMGNWERGP